MDGWRVVTGMRASLTTLAMCAVLGLVPLAAGCGQVHATGSQPATAAAAPSRASSTPVSPARPLATTPLPGIVADCGVSPARLGVRPAAIVLACADAGLGVQRLRWTSWTASGAAGHGVLYEHDCVPSCAASGTWDHYQVAVTLSAVKASPKGPWFSRLTVAWQGRRPPNSTPDSFGLMPPVTGQGN